LREIFEEATRKAPSVIFIDEIDAIAPKRAEVVGDVKEGGGPASGPHGRHGSPGHVLVIGATNVPEMIDPALRRPGRFDREIGISAPHAGWTPGDPEDSQPSYALAADVDLDQIAPDYPRFCGGRSGSALQRGWHAAVPAISAGGPLWAAPTCSPSLPGEHADFPRGFPDGPPGG